MATHILANPSRNQAIESPVRLCCARCAAGQANSVSSQETVMADFASKTTFHTDSPVGLVAQFRSHTQSFIRGVPFPAALLWLMNQDGDGYLRAQEAHNAWINHQQEDALTMVSRTFKVPTRLYERFNRWVQTPRKAVRSAMAGGAMAGIMAADPVPSTRFGGVGFPAIQDAVQRYIKWCNNPGESTKGTKRPGHHAAGEKSKPKGPRRPVIAMTEDLCVTREPDGTLKFETWESHDQDELLSEYSDKVYHRYAMRRLITVAHQYTANYLDSLSDSLINPNTRVQAHLKGGA